MDSMNVFFMYKNLLLLSRMFPHTEANYEMAVRECAARGIKGCPSRLLRVKNVEPVYYSMTYEDIEY